MRFWTSDWHLNSEIVRQTSHRPWKSAEEMNHAILSMAHRSKVSMADQIIHVGDLIQSGKDRGTEIAKDKQLKWDQIVRSCGCQLFCIEGNHDSSNDVPFVCSSMKTRIGNCSITVGHYPTWCEEAAGTFDTGRPFHPAVHACGHVHGAWKVSYDKRNCVININVGIDVHGYRLLSDADLVELVDRAFRWWKHVMTAADHRFGDGYGFAEWERDQARHAAAEAAEKKARTMEWLKANKPELYERKMAKNAKCK